jgi:O-antigen/teichoic acid export membrane protein
MSEAAPTLARQASPALALSPLLATAWRYGLSIAGPVAVSGAHFLASLLFLRNLVADEFGIFSFVMVAGGFAMSVSGAGLVLPATHSMMARDQVTTNSVFRMAVAAGTAFALLLTLATMASGASLSHAAPLGLFGAVLAYRWFARSLAYIEGRVMAALLSDMLYGALVVAGLAVMSLTHSVSLRHGGEWLLLAAAASLAPFGGRFFRSQLEGLVAGRLRDYLPAFRDVTAWSLLGVALTEATLNAHAYLVTFISGPGAFALPALGMLLMRPAALVQGARPDLERPAMMRAFEARDGKRLARILRDFHGALALALLGTLLLAVALLAFVPQLLLRQGYGAEDAALAALLCAAIMAVRSLRTPLGVLLQAAGEFKALARLSGWSAGCALLATLALLLAFGPVASLGGILLGDTVILLGIRPLAARARAKISAGSGLHA